jgi:tryptophan synthase alpha subunit
MDNMSSASGEEEAVVISKMKDRRGNVIENKGPALSDPELSGNVIENKGSYALKAGMSLKRKVVDRRW